MSNIRAFFGIEREFERYYLRLKKKLNIKKDLRDDKDLISFEFSQVASQEKYEEIKDMLLKYHPLEALETKQESLRVGCQEEAQAEFWLEKPQSYDAMIEEWDRDFYENLYSRYKPTSGPCVPKRNRTNLNPKKGNLTRQPPERSGAKGHDASWVHFPGSLGARGRAPSTNAVSCISRDSGYIYQSNYGDVVID